MSSSRDWVLAAGAAMLCSAALAQSAFPGIGRTATPKEVAAWDIDVRPDFKGLPTGSGSVAKGQEVWEGKCASCHGVFGESGEVFNPLVGGTTAADVRTGRVARLTDDAYPGRTMLMKMAHVSTLWDYINRAMPWNQPKTLSTEEVYAVTAYLLNLGGVLPDDFVLSDRNIAVVQQRVPNRNGLTAQHGLWPSKELGGTNRPDVQGSACMRNCAGEPQVVSYLPEFARNAHGNLAEQNRLVGPQRGADTTRAGSTAPVAGNAMAVTVAQSAVANKLATEARKADAGVDTKATMALLQKHTCTACHGVDKKIVGPAFQDVARKHGDRADAAAYLGAKIKAGGSGVWGAIPMPPQSLPDADAKAIAQWLAAGANP
jgi:cytochrome c